MLNYVAKILIYRFIRIKLARLLFCAYKSLSSSCFVHNININNDDDDDDDDDNYTMKWNILSLKIKVRSKTCGNLKKFFARRLTKEFPDKNWKRWTLETLCESCAQPIRSKALQEGSCRRRSSRTENSIAQLKTQRRCKCCNFSTELYKITLIQPN